jgi:hypothetical protein
LYQEGFTISGARNRLDDGPGRGHDQVEAAPAPTNSSLRAQVRRIIEFLRAA